MADAAELVPLARWVARGYAARSPTWERDDLESDALLGAVLAAQRYDPTRSATLKTYADRVIRGQILEGLVRRGRIPKSDGSWRADAHPRAVRVLDDPDMPLQVPDSADSIGDLLDRLEQAETRAWLDRAIADLATRPRQAALRCLAGQTAEQAATELGLTTATVYEATARAKRALRRAARSDGIAA